MITKKELSFSDKESIQLDCRFFGESYSIKEAWEKYGEKYITFNPLSILEFGKERIESIHASYINASSVNTEFGSFELCNTQIEEGKEHYGDDESIELLCKILMEVCNYVANTEIAYVKQYIICCI